MKRREFIFTAAAGVAALGATSVAKAAGGGTAGRQVIEFRTYSFATEEKLKTFSDFAAKSLVPALGRAGVSPAGIFRLMKADNAKLKLEADSMDVLMLLPHADAESALTLANKLDADAEFAAAAKAVLGTPMKDPVYKRIETQLLLAFPQCPKVEVPSKAETRVLQLRIYESHNEDKALRKVEMFNEGGEIVVFRRCGMNPVFFGESVAGTKMPNLHYMLGFDDQAALDAAWGKFMKDPDWIKLKADPKYADTVSNITNWILRPLPGSAI